jgi:acetylornithine aminotransferase
LVALGELFAFQRLDLAEYVDVVTVGKLLQNSALLFRADYQPDPALISGTFAGTTVGMAVGRRIVEKLGQENYLGPNGRIAELEHATRDQLTRLQQELPEAIRAFDGIGAMWSLEPVRASLAAIKALLHECYRNGLILYYSGFGEGPYRLRLFLPGGVLAGMNSTSCGHLRFSLRQVKAA